MKDMTSQGWAYVIFPLYRERPLVEENKANLERSLGFLIAPPSMVPKEGSK
jgi:hypothetical protein